MSNHRYQIGQLCVIVHAPAMPDVIGRQCIIVGLDHWFNSWAYAECRIEIQGMSGVFSCERREIRPIKPGDLPDFAEEETELDEEMVA